MDLPINRSDASSTGAVRYLDLYKTHRHVHGLDSPDCLPGLSRIEQI